MEETNKNNSGCLGFIVTIIIIAWIFNACVSEDDSKDKKVKNSYDVIINLDYEWASLTTNTPMNIIIDDKEIAHHHEAGEEDSYNVNLEKGKHEIYLKNDGIYKTKKISFKVNKDNVYFDFGAKTRLTVGVDFWMN